MAKNTTTRWDALSMRDRASLIKLYSQAGIRKLDDIRAHYNKFGEGGDKESEDYNTKLEKYNRTQSDYQNAIIARNKANDALREFSRNYKGDRVYWYWTDKGKRLQKEREGADLRFWDAKKELDAARNEIGNATLDEFTDTAYDPMYFWDLVARDRDKARKYYVEHGIRQSEKAQDVIDFFNSYGTSEGFNRIRENQKNWWLKRHPYRKIWQFGPKTALNATNWLQDRMSGLNNGTANGIYDLDTYTETSVMRSGNGHGAITVGTIESPEWPYLFALPHEIAHITNTAGFATPSGSVQAEALEQNTTTQEGHDSRPIEKHSDIEALRYLLFKEGIYDSRGNEDATAEDIKKLREKYPKIRPLIQMDDEKAAWMINHVADANDKTDLSNIAANGGPLINMFATGGDTDGENSLLWYNPKFDSTPTEEMRRKVEAATNAAREAEKRDATAKKSKKTKQDKYNDELAKSIIASGDNTRNKYLGTPNDQPLQEEHPLAAAMIGGATGKLIGNIGLSGLGEGLAKGIEWIGEKAMPSALMKGAATYLPETAGFVKAVAPWADAAALSYWSAQGANAAIDAAKRGDTLGAVGYGGLAGLPVAMPVVKNGLPWMSKVAKEAKGYVGALRDIKQNGLEIDIDLTPFGQMVEDANALDTFNRNMKRLNQFYAIGKRGKTAFPYFPNNPKLKYDLQRQYSRNLSDIYGMFVDDARSSGLSWQEFMSDPTTTSLLSSDLFSPRVIASVIATKAELANPKAFVYSSAKDRPQYLKNILRTIQEKKKLLNEYAQAYYDKFGEWPQHMPSADNLYNRAVRATWGSAYVTEAEKTRMFVDKIPRFDSLNPESGITYMLSESPSPKTSSPLNVNQLRRSIRRGKDLFREGYSYGEKSSYYAKSRYDRDSNEFNTAYDIMQDANERASKLSTRFERTYSDSDVKDKMRVAKYKAFSITRSSDNARLSSQKAKRLYENTTDPALHQIYEENPEYLEYIARTGKDPLRQETVDDFIRLQSIAMRGVTGDSKDMTTIDRFLSDPKNYSGKTGGDRLGIEDRDYSGIYTSNSYGIADRFSRPQSGYADAFRGTLLYPFEETINKALPIRDQLLQLRSNVADWDLFVNDLGVNRRDLAKAGRRIGLLAVEGNYANRQGEILPANERGYLGKKNLTIVEKEVEPNAQNINGRWGYDLKASPRDKELFIPKMTSVGDLERIEEILKNVGDLKKDPVLYNEILTLTRQRLDKANALITGSKAYKAGEYVAVHKGDLIGDAVGVGAIGLMAIPATYGIKTAIAANKHLEVIDNILSDLYGDAYPPKNENGEIDVAKEIQMRNAAERALKETLRDRENKKAFGGETAHKYNMGGDKHNDEIAAAIIASGPKETHNAITGQPYDVPLIDEHPGLDLALMYAQPGRLLTKAMAPSAIKGMVNGFTKGEGAMALMSGLAAAPSTVANTFVKSLPMEKGRYYRQIGEDALDSYRATGKVSQYTAEGAKAGHYDVPMFSPAPKNGKLYRMENGRYGDVWAVSKPGANLEWESASGIAVTPRYKGKLNNAPVSEFDFYMYDPERGYILLDEGLNLPNGVKFPTKPTHVDYLNSLSEAEQIKYLNDNGLNKGWLWTLKNNPEHLENALSDAIIPKGFTLKNGGKINTFETGGYIHIKPENRGKFTALKKRTGKTASWFKAHGTPAQKKMATFALNAAKWHKK